MAIHFSVGCVHLHGQSPEINEVNRKTRMHDPFAIHLEDSDLKREKQKARDLRKSQWWKRRCSKGICSYCNEPTSPGDLTMDHVVPISRGGKSIKGNVVPCCKECNTRKKELLPMEWEQFISNKKIDAK
jgi:5-methylcytosine-specific restriction protein A